jgi:hypothetical protein
LVNTKTLFDLEEPFLALEHDTARAKTAIKATLQNPL